MLEKQNNYWFSNFSRFSFFIFSHQFTVCLVPPLYGIAKFSAKMASESDFSCFLVELSASRTKTSQRRRKYLSFWQFRKIIGPLFKNASVNCLACLAAFFSQASFVFSSGVSIPFTRTAIFLQNR